MPPRYAGAGQLGELVEFREGFYRCLASWGDALFELSDATLSSPSGVGSVPQLSLEPVFRRSHGSLYKALDRGRSDEARLRTLLIEHRPKTWPLIFAVDASTWARCDAECSPERGFYYSASKHSAGSPMTETSRSSSSTPAMTPSPWATTWPTCGPRCSPASGTTGSFTPILLLTPTASGEPAGALRALGGVSSARVAEPGRTPRRAASPLILAMAPSRCRPGMACTRN